MRKKKTVWISEPTAPGGPGVTASIALAASVIFVLSAGALIAWFSYRKASDALINEMQKRLLSISRPTAMLVSEKWNPKDRAVADAEHLSLLLQQIRADHDLESLFVFDRDLKCVVDARSSVKPGKQYSAIQLAPEGVAAAWKGTAAVTPSRSLEGVRLMSTYAPVMDAENDVVAVLYAETDIPFLLPLSGLRIILFLGVGAAAALAVLDLLFLRVLLRTLSAAHSRLARWQRRLLTTKVADEVAHEIRNPLGIIRATSDNLRRAHDPQKTDTRFDDVEEEIDRLADIT
ncbi:histidine kinase dimerization/phospho-acceptor domain-containing protein, partial [Planctomycetota bacterium]